MQNAKCTSKLEEGSIRDKALVSYNVYGLSG